jgi:hypothetical protein
MFVVSYYRSGSKLFRGGIVWQPRLHRSAFKKRSRRTGTCSSRQRELQFHVRDRWGRERRGEHQHCFESGHCTLVLARADLACVSGFDETPETTEDPSLPVHHIGLLAAHQAALPFFQF